MFPASRAARAVCARLARRSSLCLSRSRAPPSFPRRRPSRAPPSLARRSRASAQAVATVEEEMELAACDSASEITGATQKWDDDVPLFAGGSSALPLAPPAPAQASGDDGGGGDDAARAAGALEPAAALALEREQGKDAAAKPATNGSGAAGGGHVRIKGRIASCASIAYLSEASAQVELDRSRWQSVRAAARRSRPFGPSCARDVPRASARLRSVARSRARRAGV
jgi:hypothetical protein